MGGTLLKKQRFAFLAVTLSLCSCGGSSLSSSSVSVASSSEPSSSLSASSTTSSSSSSFSSEPSSLSESSEPEPQFSEDWEFDESFHWHPAIDGSGERAEYGPHVYEEGCSSFIQGEMGDYWVEGTCSSCGFVQRTPYCDVWSVDPDYLSANSGYEKIFKKAVPVFPTSLFEERNVAVTFSVELSVPGDYRLKFVGKEEYQIFCGDQLLGYGPAKSAHGYHLVDTYQISAPATLTFLVATYHTLNYDRVNEPPFFAFEIEKGEDVVAFSSLSTQVYRYQPRIQKTPRFSLQRCFVEAYRNPDLFEKGISRGDSLELSEVKYGESFQYRTTSYPRFETSPMSLAKTNAFKVNDPVERYPQYMYEVSLGIFYHDVLDIDPGEEVSRFELLPAFSPKQDLAENESSLYRSSRCTSGFIELSLICEEQCEMFLVFDEVCQKLSEEPDINPFRMPCENYIYLSFEPGEHRFVSMQPYGLQFLRVFMVSGSAREIETSILPLENPDCNISLSCGDEKIQTIFEAAKATFASNAVDILVDCPNRERAGWLADSLFTSEAERLFTGQNLCETQFLSNYANLASRPELPKQMLPMCYPADFYNGVFIPNWAMFYVLELDRHGYLLSDNDVVSRSLPLVEELVSYFSQFENEVGMLEDLDGWVFVEWSAANDPESIEGVNVPTNILYSAFLESSARLLNKPALLAKADSLRETIREVAFDGEFYVDNLIRSSSEKLIRTNRYSETTQYYAFFFGLETPETQSNLFSLLMTKFGPNRSEEETYSFVASSNAIWGYYMRFKLMCDYGLFAEVIREITEYFYTMAETTGTLWEHVFMSGSLNHGCASYIGVLLFKALTGFTHINEEGVYQFSDDFAGTDCRFLVTTNTGRMSIEIKNGERSIQLDGK